VNIEVAGTAVNPFQKSLRVTIPPPGQITLRSMAQSIY
jgi:hypothetical protein